MGRAPRNDYPGAVALVTNRGTAQTMLFRTDGDRRAFLAILGQLEARFGVVVNAFVLMGNHYHLLVRSRDGRLAEAMCFLDGGYARRFNAVHDRKGAFFQGRYDARLIECDVGFQRAGAYLHLNPLRAGLVEVPLAYRWSSLPAYARGKSPATWLALDLLAERSGPDYLAFVMSHAAETAELALDAAADWWSGHEPGPDDEDRLSGCDAEVAAVFGASVDQIYIVVKGRSNPVRMAAIASAARCTNLPIAEIATRYGLRTPGGVYKAVARLAQLAERDPAVAAKIRTLGLAR